MPSSCHKFTWMKKVTGNYLLLFLLIMVACKSSNHIMASKSEETVLLFSNQWILAEAGGIKETGNNHACLSFTTGEKNLVSGSTGCNRLNGSFVLKANHHVAFSPLAVTRMACLDENTAALEKKLLDALNRTKEWWADSSQLLLKNGDTVFARFIPQKILPIDQAKLNGSWELVFITDNELPFNDQYPEKKPTISFNLPGIQVGGNSSCNGFGTEVKMDGNKITFKDPISTMIACPGNGEPLFFKTLKTITSFKLENDQLLTFYAGDAEAMRFIKK